MKKKQLLILTLLIASAFSTGFVKDLPSSPRNAKLETLPGYIKWEYYGVVVCALDL